MVRYERRKRKIRNKSCRNEKIFNKFILYLVCLLIILVLNLLKFNEIKIIRSVLNRELSKNIVTEKKLDMYLTKIKNLDFDLLAEKIGFEKKNDVDVFEINESVKNKMREENKEESEIKKNLF
ncbi:MAG: hypothetical protein IJU86_04715 [Firmicutes bacterium]|nr:hypothetical protein [Bacillota bacterium]